MEYWDNKRVEILIDTIDMNKTEKIMKKIREQSGWGNKDTFILNSIQSKEFYSYILSSEQFVKVLIDFLRFIGSASEFKAVKTNILTALKKLENENNNYAFKVKAIYKTLGINESE